MNAQRTARPGRRTVADDGGFTFIELLVTMTLAMIVLFAALKGSEVFAQVTKSAGDTSRAQDTARATVRQVVQTLRQGRLPAGQQSPMAPAYTSTRRDVVLAAWVSGATNPAPGSVPGWVRLCASTDGRSLLIGVRGDVTYAAPGACATSDATGGWSYGTLVAGTLRNPGTLFDYGSGTCVGGLTVGSATAAPCTPSVAATTTIGIRLSVARDAASDTGTSVVRDAVNLRNGVS